MRARDSWDKVGLFTSSGVRSSTLFHLRSARYVLISDFMCIFVLLI